MIELKNIAFAHRGIHNNLNIPENSIRAFEKAINRNIPIELDVHILKDNTLVVFHDDNLVRMTGVFKNIRNYTYEELRKLKLLDTDYNIPTLKEVLNLVDGKVPLNIELKNDKRVNELGEQLTKVLDNYKGDFIIQSFYPKIIKWFKMNRPNYTRGLLISDDFDNKSNNYFNVILKYTSPNFLSVYKKIIKNKKIQEYRKNFSILTWTIKNDSEIDKYKDYADGFIRNIR